MIEQQRKPYNKPNLLCYHDLRTRTLGNSIFPGESKQSARQAGDFAEESMFEESRSRSSSAGDSGGRGGRSGS